VSEFARILGEDRHMSLLEQTLQEEKETDEKLTQLAKGINPEANREMEQDEKPSKSNGRKKR
jgi:ferritin-like metal-binding protein YciE